MASPLEVAVARVLNRVVLKLHGELDAYSAPALRQALWDLIEEEGDLNVVIDLSAVTFIDSSGLGVLVGAQRNARRRGGELVLSGPTSATFKVLEMTGLHKLFTITRA